MTTGGYFCLEENQLRDLQFSHKTTLVKCCFLTCCKTAKVPKAVRPSRNCQLVHLRHVTKQMNMVHIHDIDVPKDESHIKIDIRTICRINNATKLTHANTLQLEFVIQRLRIIK